MARYLNCENPRCRFILDRRMNGKLLATRNSSSRNVRNAEAHGPPLARAARSR
jgi:hypothetical protein